MPPRVYAISDLHADFAENRRWVFDLADRNQQADRLIVAGDVCDDLVLLQEILAALRQGFGDVFFVPGNHELWVEGGDFDCSLKKLDAVLELCDRLGIVTRPWQGDGLTLVPLLSWYDHTFAEPDAGLQRAWRDYRACRWPAQAELADINQGLLARNAWPAVGATTVISYSHFLPRIDLMPAEIPLAKRRVYPVLGSTALGAQVAELRPMVHVYGHSHVNRALQLNGTLFVNNALGYPSETRISQRTLVSVCQGSQVEYVTHPH